LRGEAVTDTTLKLSFDGHTFEAQLAAISELAERLPEVRNSLLGYLDAGEQLFRFDVDRRAAAVAGECGIRPYPSDALIGLLAARRTGDPNLLFVEHAMSPEVALTDQITTSHLPQSGDAK